MKVQGRPSKQSKWDAYADRHRKKALRDLIIIVLLTTLIYILAYTYDTSILFIDLGKWIEKVQETQLDEFIITFVFVVLAFMVFSWRRWQDLKKELSMRHQAEDEVKNLSKQVEFILGATQTNLDIIDGDFNILYIDPEWEKIYGDPDGKKCYEYFMGRTESCPDCGVRKALETKTTIVTEEHLVKEGNRPIQVTTTPFQNDLGEWLVAEVNVDISARKRIEEEVRRARDELDLRVKERTAQLTKANELLQLELSQRKWIEDQLRKLSRAIEQSPSSVVITDIHGNIEYVNPKFILMTGYAFSEVQGKNPRFLKSGEILAQGYARLWNTITSGGEWQGEFHNKRKNGELYWEFASISPIKNSDGVIEHYLKVAEDITERKRTEAALKVSEAEYRELVESANSIILRMDTKGNVTFFNEFAQRFFGFSAEEIIGKDVLGTIVPEIDSFGNDLKSMIKDIVAYPERYVNNENENMRRSGERAWISWTNKTIYNDRQEFTGVLCVGNDITARKRAEEQLQLTQFSINRAADAVFWIGPDGRILYVNNAACNYLGYGCNELLQMGISDIDSSLPEEAWQGHWKELKERGSLTMESLHRARDGRVFPVEVSLNYVEFNGKEYDFAFVRDITERKRLEHLKDDFISTVSHELRTPLSITKEGISLILDKIPGEINEKQSQILTTSKDNIDRLARIINSLLDISKIEAGKIEMKRETINIGDLVRKVAFNFTPKITAKGLELKLDIPQDQIMAYADTDRIIQVFTNLINNAIKFTEKGHIEISCGSDEREVRCCVADTGIGIARENLVNVFNKFTQFGRSPGAGEKGTGLGLAIIKGIIEMHDGRIWVESEFGQGTKFIFALPKR